MASHGPGCGCLNCSYARYNSNVTITTASSTGGSSTYYYITDEQACAMYKPKKESMSLSTMMKKLLDGDTQTLVKAGYLDSSLELTDKGWKTLKAMLFDANKAALVVAAQADIDEAKAQQK